MSTSGSIRLGLTGSIAMGKSTTAQMFAEAGVPVWDADATVHTLYAPGGAATAPLAQLVPEALTAEGIDRKILSRHIETDPTLLTRIEAIVHPLVRADREAFLKRHATAKLVLLDIPLLFETDGAATCDQILVVTAPPEVQRTRALARPGMTEARFDHILSRQTPDAEKRARADHIIDTSKGLEAARAAVHSLLEALTQDPTDA
ncbi:MAG: dephospho-CoA kinase [Pseudomonadota bacterium]